VRRRQTIRSRWSREPSEAKTEWNGPRKPAVYNLEDPNPIEPEAPAKTEPVAAPVPVKKKKVIITDMNTGIRKVDDLQIWNGQVGRN
jgi:hypothetical protein